MPGGLFSGYRLFFKQYVQHFKSTGSITPSSRFLANSLSRYVKNGTGGRQILEVGPGTGAVTQSIVRRMQADDRLSLIELNEQFVAHLRERFASEPAFQAVASRADVIQGRLEELPADRQYDLIISGLPLNNFTVESVEAILAIYRRLLRPGGTLSFFEYIAIRPVRAAVSGRDERTRLRGIGQALRQTLAGSEIKKDWIWPNIPPAWVHHVRFAAASSLD